MSGPLIGLVTLIYLAVVVSYLFANRPWMALVFFGYAIANIGLIMEGQK